MAETHDRKNADYAHEGNPYSNFEEAAKYAGVTVDDVFNVLIGVKTARLVELLKSGKEPQNESVQDTLLDRAVYAALHASYHMREEEESDEAEKLINERELEIQRIAQMTDEERLGLRNKNYGSNSGHDVIRGGTGGASTYHCTRFPNHDGPHALIDMNGGLYDLPVEEAIWYD